MTDHNREEREALIEKLRTLNIQGTEFDGGSSGNPDHPDRPSFWRFSRETAEAWADEIMAVFEQAHTPTGGEWEALARLIQAAKDMRSWFTEKADNVLERIKTDTHEDVMLYHDAVSVLVAARQMIGLLADSSEPQDEPTDAQGYNPNGKTIAATVDWVKRNYAYRPGEDDEYVGQIIEALEAAHAALSAAAENRP